MRYRFIKINDRNIINNINNEGTVLMGYISSSGTNGGADGSLVTGNGGALTELIKKGAIVFSGWQVCCTGYFSFIDDKGLTWFTMSTTKEDDNDYGVYTIDNSKRLSKIIDRRSAWFGMLWCANNNETLLFLKRENGVLGYDTLSTCRYGALTSIVDFNTISNMGYERVDFPSLNDLGTVAFWCHGTGEGIFMGNGGPLTQIVATGTDFRRVGFPCVNDSNTVSFFGCYYDGIQGIFVNIGGFVTPYIISPMYSAYQISSAPGMNDHGTVVFGAGGGALGYGSPGGIFTGPDPIADKVIAGGDTLFGKKVAGCGLNIGARNINNKGQVVFWAELEDGTGGGIPCRP